MKHQQQSPDLSVDRLIVEIARLKLRVDELEKAAFSAPDEYVEGWTRAAKLVGLSSMTCKRRYAAGDFPKPCKMTTIERAPTEIVPGRVIGARFEKLTWKRADLVSYAEGRYR